MNLPGLAITKRDRTDVPHARRYTPQFRGRVPERIALKAAPNPAWRGDIFWNYGKTYEHAYPHQWVVVDLSIADKLSVQAPVERSMVMPRVPSALTVAMPRGRHNAIPQRVNIDNPGNMAYGDMAALRAGIPYAPQYAKLI